METSRNCCQLLLFVLVCFFFILLKNRPLSVLPFFIEEEFDWSSVVNLRMK
jgi:hypothetical protein